MTAKSRSVTGFKVMAALAVVYIVTGTVFIAIKVISHNLRPELLTALRLLGAAVLLAPLTAWRLRQREHWPSFMQVAAAAVSGLLLFAIGQTGLAWGIAQMPAGVAAVIGSAAPLFIVLFSALLLRDAPPMRQLIGVLLGFTGITALTWTSPDGEIVLSGVVALLVSGAAWAAGSLYSRRASLPTDPFLTLNLQLLIGGFLTLPLVMLGAGENGLGLPQLTWSEWAGLVYLSVAAIVAFLAFNWLNKNTSSTIANTFFYIGPVITMTLGAIFLGDTITLTKLAAAAITLAGVTLIMRS